MAAREYEIETARLAASRAAVTLRVFVGGPYINPEWDVVPEDKREDLALVARFEIKKFIESELGYSATIGEDKAMEIAYTEHLEDFFEASTMEFAHVVDHCDAVVILPSSPGSFCELGYFAAADGISTKMMIILDGRYSNNRGYIHAGPARQANLFGSTVIEKDYSDMESLLGEVRRFLNRISRKKWCQNFGYQANGFEFYLFGYFSYYTARKGARR